MIKPEIKISFPKEGEGEGYVSSYAGGVVTVKAESERAAAFARAQLEAAIASGYFGEFLGTIEPRFPIRPLWMKNGTVAIEPLGYNALIGRDYHVHETTFHEKSGLQEELALEELKSIQEDRLIFWIKEADPEWLPSFFDEVEGDTIIALDVAHPIWEQLRVSPDVSSTRLMPVLRLGKGLWPLYEFDRIERALSRCYRHPFAGLLVVAESLNPNVWVAGQAQWRQQSAHLVGETWFRAFRPDIDYPRFSEELRHVASVAHMIQNWPEGDPRIIAQSILGQLRFLKMRFALEEQPYFSDRFTFFSRDVCRYLMHFLQERNVPMLALFEDDDKEESFWTSITDGKVTFHEIPNKGAEGSLMRKIYDEFE